MRHYHLLAAGIAAALILPLVGCDDDDPMQPQPDPAMVRIVNAAEGTTNIEVEHTGSGSAVATLDFRETTTTCVQVPAGTRTFTFESGDVDIASVTAELEEGDRYLLVLASPGAGDERRAVIASDEHVVGAGNNGLRLVNATATAGDVYVTTPTGTPGAAFRVSGNLGPLALGNFQFGDLLQRATEHTRVRLFDVDATTEARADVTLTGLPGSRIATVVFTDDGAEAEDRAFLVFPCP